MMDNLFDGDTEDLRTDFSSAANPVLPMFEDGRDYQAEADAIRNGTALVSTSYEYDGRLGDVALALCDKGYPWAQARDYVMQVGNRIPPGSESQAIAWIEGHVTDRR